MLTGGVASDPGQCRRSQTLSGIAAGSSPAEGRWEAAAAAPHAPSIPPHPLPGGAALGVPAVARSQAGLPGSGAAVGALVGNRRGGDGRLGEAFGEKGLGIACGLIFPENKPQTSQDYEEDANGTGRRRSSRAATAPAGASAVLPRGLRSLRKPRRVLAGLCLGGERSPGGTARLRVHSSVFEEIKKKTTNHPDFKSV